MYCCLVAIVYAMVDTTYVALRPQYYFSFLKILWQSYALLG